MLVAVQFSFVASKMHSMCHSGGGTAQAAPEH
jgi:hypothetical protein